MEKHIVYDAALTKADRLVLKALAVDVETHQEAGKDKTDRRGIPDAKEERDNVQPLSDEDEKTLSYLNALNDVTSSDFEPTVFQGSDYDGIDWKKPFNQYVLKHYIRAARSIVRVETDVVMLTHLLLYFTTSVPSAAFLFFGSFTWIHGVLHSLMQLSYMGAYTLMMHQHIHQRGVLHKSLGLFDSTFPYLLDPLMGHTWNSYFYHHVKHHHVEGNGPGDLSSTMSYQRDRFLHFLHYVGRFIVLVWAELPIYFVSRKRHVLGLKTLFWELSSYVLLYSAFKYNRQAAICVLLVPFVLMRLGMMVGNWGQHAFVDPDEPDSDYRSSITLIDVPSNRYSFNDGYHTSHHLNPMRHWREHPNSFLKQRHVYASQNALVFHNIDYIFITIKLMMKDYEHLAKCLVPIGEEQLAWSMEERMEHLKSRTRQFTPEEMKLKYN
ncbi:hypothetical protein BJ166DRAFT_309551 [Pestalotiopsis sp. NC0098]|nr:hypothetical protein BJ166DRAFT_309551 [Pestalotiopsis sp. NC0098]